MASNFHHLYNYLEAKITSILNIFCVVARNSEHKPIFFLSFLLNLGIINPLSHIPIYAKSMLII